jgi:hypothetical protein
MFCRLVTEGVYGFQTFPMIKQPPALQSQLPSELGGQMNTPTKAHTGKTVSKRTPQKMPTLVALTFPVTPTKKARLAATKLNAQDPSWSAGDGKSVGKRKITDEYDSDTSTASSTCAKAKAARKRVPPMDMEKVRKLMVSVQSTVNVRDVVAIYFEQLCLAEVENVDREIKILEVRYLKKMPADFARGQKFVYTSERGKVPVGDAFYGPCTVSRPAPYFISEKEFREVQQAWELLDKSGIMKDG